MGGRGPSWEMPCGVNWIWIQARRGRNMTGKRSHWAEAGQPERLSSVGVWPRSDTSRFWVCCWSSRYGFYTCWRKSTYLLLCGRFAVISNNKSKTWFLIFLSKGWAHSHILLSGLKTWTVFFFFLIPCHHMFSVATSFWLPKSLLSLLFLPILSLSLLKSSPFE